MKFIGGLLLMSVILSIMGGTYEQEILDFRQQLDEEYRDPATSPLTKKERKQFTGHHFFPIDESYRVTATVELLPKGDDNKLPFNTSSGDSRIYQRYARLSFELNGSSYQLYVYFNPNNSNPEYDDYAFIPFTDETSGEESYGGGRYIDLQMPLTDTVVVDFNKSYNPYCAYTTGYSCAIPPRENHLNTYVRAGIKAYH